MAGTPNTRRAITAMRARFDLLYGVYNPRHIGSNPLRRWSQHAGAEPAQAYYGNAADIVHIQYGYNKDPRHQAELDKVYAYLDAHRDELSIRQVLWRVPAHFDHIHVDFWPKMADEFWRRHPTKGGPVVVRYEDGTLGDTYGGLIPAPPPPPSNMEDDIMFCKRGETSEIVLMWQYLLQALGYEFDPPSEFFGGTMVLALKGLGFDGQQVDAEEAAAILIRTGTGTGGPYALLDHPHDIPGQTI